MPTFYLHAGMFKTGTTAAQKYMHDNAEMLRAHGLAFPAFLGANHSRFCALNFWNTNDKQRKRLDEKTTRDRADLRSFGEADLRAFVDEAFAADTDVILSAESASHAKYEDLVRLGKATGATGDRFRTLMLLRPPQAYARGIAQQSIRGIQGATWQSLAERVLAPRYSNLVQPHVAAFGEDAVRLRVYHPDKLVSGDVFQTLLAMMDRPRPGLSDARAPRHNESISLTAAKVLSILNEAKGDRSALDALPRRVRFLLTRSPLKRPVDKGLETGGRQHRWRPHLMDGIVEIPGERFILPQEIAEAVAQKAAPHVAWVAERIGEDITAYDEPADTPRPRIEDLRTFSPEEVDAICETLLAQAEKIAPAWAARRKRQAARKASAAAAGEGATAAMDGTPAPVEASPGPSPSGAATGPAAVAAAAPAGPARPGRARPGTGSILPRPARRGGGGGGLPLYVRQRTPLFHPDLPFVLFWSQKAGCTTVVKWFFEKIGLLDEALAHSSWIHDYEVQVFKKQKDYRKSVASAIESGKYHRVKVVRDPWKRSASAFLILGEKGAWRPSHWVHHHWAWVNESLEAEGLDSRDEVSFVQHLSLLEKYGTAPNHHVTPQFVEGEGDVLDEVVPIERFVDWAKAREREANLKPMDEARVTASAHHHTVDKAVTARLGPTPEATPIARGAFRDGRFPATGAFVNERSLPQIERYYAADIAAYGEHYERPAAARMQEIA